MAELFARAAGDVQSLSQPVHPDETVDQTFVGFVSVGLQFYRVSEEEQRFLILLLLYEKIAAQYGCFYIVGI